MTSPPRLADPAALRARLLELLDEHLGWRPDLDGATDPPDVGVDLLRAFLQLVEIVADHVNAVPEHRLLAFLDLLGLSARPPTAARCPVAFTLAPGAPDSVLVPAGTQVAARPRPGEAEPPVFTTVAPLYATTSRLSAVVVNEPARDRFTEWTGLGPVPLFVGEVPVSRQLVVADPVLALPLPKDVVLHVLTSSPSTGWLHRVRWERWTADGWSAAGVPAPGIGTSSGSFVPVTFPELEPLLVPEDGTSDLPALRGTLELTVPAATGLHGPGETAADPVACDGARQGLPHSDDSYAVETTRPFAPFRRLVPGAWFALACDDAFARPDAEVSLSVTPTGAVMPRLRLDVAWSCSTALGWQPLGVTEWHDGVAAVPGTAFTAGGRISFTPPVAWSGLEVDGRRHRWLRAELRSADGASATAGDPPSLVLQRLSVGYRWPLPRIDDVTVRADVKAGTTLELDAARVDFDPVDLSVDVWPFGPRPRLNATFAVAAGAAFATPGLRVRLHVEPTSEGPYEENPEAQPPPARPRGIVLALEYFSRDGRRWREVASERGRGSVTDTTAALSVSGDIDFTVPDDAAPCSVAGEERAWLRLRLTGGDYGTEASIVSEDGTPQVVPATLAPPVIKKVTAVVEGSFDPQPVAGLLIRNGDAVRDHRGESGRDTVAFPPAADPRPSLDLGFEGALGDRPVSLHVDVEVPPGRPGGDGSTEPVVVAWERFDPDESAWTRIALADGTRGLTRPDVVTFLPPADLVTSRRWGRTRTWLRARWLGGAYPAPPLLRGLTLNAAVAGSAVLVRGEVVGAGNGRPGQVLRLMHRPALEAKAVEVLAHEGWQSWQVVESFDESEPADRHVVVDPAAGELLFGDGRRGRVPPARAPVRATYRHGGGATGNREAGEVTELVSSVPFVVSARNPVRAHGGQDPETATSVRERGPRTLRHRGRAVAAADIEDLARDAHADVARAWAVTAGRGAAATPPGTVGILVIPRAGGRRPRPSRELLLAVEDRLGAAAGAGVDVWAAGPGWVEISVAAEVVPTDPALAGDVELAVLAAIDRYLDPVQGGDDGTGWVFGRPVVDADLTAIVHRVPGVDHVRRLVVGAVPRDEPPLPNAWLPFPGSHTVTMAGGG